MYITGHNRSLIVSVHIYVVESLRLHVVVGLLCGCRILPTRKMTWHGGALRFVRHTARRRTNGNIIRWAALQPNKCCILSLFSTLSLPLIMKFVQFTSDCTRKMFPERVVINLVALHMRVWKMTEPLSSKIVGDSNLETISRGRARVHSLDHFNYFVRDSQIRTVEHFKLACILSLPS